MLKTICSLIPLVTISSFFFVLCSYLFQISAFLAVSWRHPHLLSLSSSLCLSFPLARSLTHQFLLFVEGLLQLGNGTFFITLKLTHYLTQSLSHSLTHMLARSPAHSLARSLTSFSCSLMNSSSCVMASSASFSASVWSFWACSTCSIRTFLSYKTIQC